MGPLSRFPNRVSLLSRTSIRGNEHEEGGRPKVCGDTFDRSHEKRQESDAVAIDGDRQIDTRK